MLVGPGSIVGRSLKIESRNDSIANLRTLGCCNIVRVPKGSVQQSPRTAVCDFGSQTVGGKITFQQAYGTFNWLFKFIALFTVVRGGWFDADF